MIMTNCVKVHHCMMHHYNNTCKNSLSAIEKLLYIISSTHQLLNCGLSNYVNAIDTENRYNAYKRVIDYKSH